jgi:hypothetical protein
LGGIEANLLSGPLSTLSSTLTSLAAQPITDSNWLSLLAGGLNLALLVDLLSGDESEEKATSDNAPSLSEKLASLGGDLVDSLEGYALALARLSAAALDGSAVLDGVGLPVYRLVALHAPGIQDWQFEALSQPWDSQVIADVAFQLSLGDVVGLAGDLHLPGEVTFRGFDPLSSNPQLPSDLDALVSGFANLHSNLAYHPVGLTALSDLEVENEEGALGELWSFAYPLSEPSVNAQGDVVTEITVATRRPAIRLGSARGNSTWRPTWPRLRPRARPASLSPDGTWFRPVTRPRSRGSRA